MILNPYIFGNSVNPKWSGIIGYWPGDNNTTDIILGNNLTLQNGATYGTGLINQCFSYDGINDYSNTPDNVYNSLIGSGDFAFTCLINPSSLANGAIMYLGNSLITKYIYFGLTGGAGALTLQMNNGVTSVVVISNLAVTTGGFQQVGVSSTSGDIRFTVNGVNQGINVSTTRQDLSGTIKNEFGEITGGIVNINARIDEKALFNTVKPDADMALIWNGGSPTQYPL